LLGGMSCNLCWHYLNLPIFLGGMSCNLCWHYLNLVVCTWANPGKIESNPDVASRHPLVVDFGL
jgi:hypothetical protein